VLKDTIVASNANDAECGVTIACPDLSTCKSPKLLGSSSCGTSHVTDSGLPGTSWGVCASD
jgi:hypothetical protein